jgi:hypothetical protein
MLATDIPKNVGDLVTVQLTYKSSILKELDPNPPTTVSFTGKVVGRAEFDPPNSIRITGDSKMPVRVIPFHQLLKWNDIEVTQPELKKIEPSFHIVTGSKGKQYKITVSTDGSCVCTCPGFGYRKRCSHIQQFLDRKNNE